MKAKNKDKSIIQQKKGIYLKYSLDCLMNHALNTCI